MTNKTYEFMMAYYRVRIDDYARLRSEVWVKYINSNRFRLITNYKLYRKYHEYTQMIERYQKCKDELSKQYD